MPPIRDRYVHAVRGCARCGQTHTGLEAKRFVRPIADCDDVIYTHWATCPTTGDPILVGDVPLPTEPPAEEQDGVLLNMHLDDDADEIAERYSSPRSDINFELYDRNVT